MMPPQGHVMGYSLTIMMVLLCDIVNRVNAVEW